MTGSHQDLQSHEVHMAALAQGGAPPPARVERVQGSPAVEARVTPEEVWDAALELLG